MAKTTRDMSDRHEDHLAAVLDGRKTRGSGNQSRDQMDGKQSYREQHYTFTWDGKATLAKSISVTRQMWAKAKEQAHWAVPILPLRFYANERLTAVEADLVVIDLDTLAEIQRDANAWRAIGGRQGLEKMIGEAYQEGDGWHYSPEEYVAKAMGGVSGA
jgi:hypothetical protein